MHTPICLYEDSAADQLWPFATLSSVMDIFWGTGTQLAHVARHIPLENISLWVRLQHVEAVKDRHRTLRVNTPNLAGAFGFINARTFFSPTHWDAWSCLDPLENHMVIAEGNVVGLLVQQDHLQKMWSLLEGGASDESLHQFAKEIGAQVHEWDAMVWIRFPWDLIKYHDIVLRETLKYVPTLGQIKGKMGSLTSLAPRAQISIAQDVQMEDFVWINAEKGPVVIESGVVIEAFTRLEGPLYVGKNTRLMGGKISNCSIGPGCKIAGEVSSSIWMGNANKAHHGYIGNSVIGEWVNLGAMTTTSNLKNTYDPIQVKDRSGQAHQTDVLFLGSLIGDHTKTGIGTLLNTGTLVGVGCNLIGSGLHHGCIPDFRWGESKRYIGYQLDKFLKVVEAVMARRNLTLRETVKNQIRTYFEGVNQ
jgi:UDP-N-acetylglucosamine diphosphorylase/glucosamine-1-phosphate N-acetyltransferase